MEFTRGDTQPLKFQRLDAYGNAITATPDEMFFTVKIDFSSEDVVFQKTLDDMTFGEDDCWHFVIEPSDTQNLPVRGYVYDIEVTTGENVFTISKGTLKLLPEATWSANK
jgi:hypothetical protein